MKCGLFNAYTQRTVTSGVTRDLMARGSHSFTCHPHVYPWIEWAILHSFRNHSPDGVARARWRTSGSAYCSIYRVWKDETLSWPSWLTYNRRFTHISGHPSAAGRAWDRESSPAKDRRSTTSNVSINGEFVKTSHKVVSSVLHTWRLGWAFFSHCHSQYVFCLCSKKWLYIRNDYI